MRSSLTTVRDPQWLHNSELLWVNRRTLARVGMLSLLFSTIIAFILPKQYESIARILPPQQTSGGAAMLAALAGRPGAAAGLGSLAGGLLGGHSTGALYVNLLHSSTIAQHLIDRFRLQHVYRKRYTVDAAKKLASRTHITEDAKSGVITIVVVDNDRQQARDMAQAYVDELNHLVARVNTSSAHREREFIEQRLTAVRRELQRDQLSLSAFSAQNAALDIREQTRASVEASARLQGQLVALESELSALREVYGRDNVRVRATEARLWTLRQELNRANGTSNVDTSLYGDRSYLPSLNRLPALSVTWANLYRDVRVQETVFDMLSAQYESARIEEAKSIPSASIIDFPGIPEKKSSPHRLWIVLLSTTCCLMAASLLLIYQEYWSTLNATDPRKALVRQIVTAIREWSASFRRLQ